jgi:hypothetical protein
MPALLAGWIYIFLITFKELSIALLALFAGFTGGRGYDLGALG